MGIYLNSKAPFENYRSIVSDPYFVDKTALISELVPAIGKEQRFFCITRPRRFGKSVMANMLGAFFGKGQDGAPLFHDLAIGKESGHMEHLNKHDVIFMDLSRMPRGCDHYGQYIKRIQDDINRDLAEAYPEISIDITDAVWDVLGTIFEKTGDKFIFIIDEWDAIFHKAFIREGDKQDFLGFLRNLLKGQGYVALTYMTGVLPIAKYTSGSELNMFLEYDMATKKKFSEYFGFLDEEVDRLFTIYQDTTDDSSISREDLRVWYDGYHTARGKRIYNPRSIVCALSDDELAGYWTSSGPYDEIFYYIRHDIYAVREDLVLMIAGEGIDTEIWQYSAVSMELETKAQIYSAMVIYGLLTYKDGKVYIPNREIMEQFKVMLMTKASLGYIHELAKESEKMLRATLTGDTQTMARILKFAHDTESPIFSYNSEIELSAIVNLVYLAARDRYRVEREDKAGEGYVDFIFYPERPDADAIILELKIDSTPKETIQQIKDKNYALRFRGKLGEKARYTGRILAVGISYQKKTKEHFCAIEILA